MSREYHVTLSNKCNKFGMFVDYCHGRERQDLISWKFPAAIARIVAPTNRDLIVLRDDTGVKFPELNNETTFNP